MYQASTTVELDVPPQLLLDAVWQVEHYPEFVRGVKRVELIAREGGKARARFVASIAGMEFQYELEILRSESEVSWRRITGSFRDAQGAMRWLGGKKFQYENALDPGFAVPDVAMRFVLERSLPRLIREFQDRARLLQARERGAVR